MSVVLFVGVNGVGKTTTIGKIAQKLKEKFSEKGILNPNVKFKNGDDFDDFYKKFSGVFWYFYFTHNLKDTRDENL